MEKIKKYRILKYKSNLLDDNGTKAYRIRALKNFNDVRKGDLGGWIQQESNLSQDGDCWVYDDAVVRDNARVSDNAVIRDDAEICHNAVVRDDAVVRDATIVRDDAIVRDYAVVRDNDVVTKDVLFVNKVYDLTLTDNHIYYGCVRKTIQEWKEWLDDDSEIIETPRNTKKFKIIEKTLRYAIKHHELR